MARGKSGGMITHSKPAIPSGRAFGDPDEIAGRDKAFSGEAPTTFHQIGPEDGGTSAANMDSTATDKGGAFKFSEGCG
jgi:hypothetical protein